MLNYVNLINNYACNFWHPHSPNVVPSRPIIGSWFTIFIVPLLVVAHLQTTGCAFPIEVNLALISFPAMTVFVQRMLSVMHLSLMSYVLQFISFLNVKASLLMDL